MTLTYFENDVSHLVEDYFQLSVYDDDIPFQSKILPQGHSHITHIFYGKQNATVQSKIMPIEGLIISGQFFRSYQFQCLTKAMSFGISFHPTALYKILHTDISQLENKHLSLLKFHPDFYSKIENIFKELTSSDIMVNELNSLFSNTELTINKNTKDIDFAINLITQKDGLIDITEILERVGISQKSLETQFKKIVGLTPGKYIRSYRFLKLMKKYERQEIAIKDLMYMFDYYDRSHFTKDFKLFMNETPKSYFKKEYPLLKAVFNKA